MADDTPSATAVAASPALRFRMPKLHRSTYVVAALVAAVLFLANIPARIDRTGPLLLYARLDHGWPWTFLRRVPEVEWYDDLIDDLVFDTALTERRDRMAHVEASAFWTIPRKIDEVSWLCILGDTAVAVVIVTAAAAVFEAWRRRRARLCQFYLLELLALTTVVSALLSWISVSVRERGEEQQALREMDFVDHDEDLAGPHWLRKLVGSRPFVAFDRVDRILIPTGPHPGHLPSVSMADELFRRWRRRLKDPAQISHFRHLEWLDCGGEPASILAFLSRPGRLRRLRFLPVREEDLIYLRQFTGLEYLRINPGYRLSNGGRDLVSEAGVANIAALGRLRYLDLSEVSVDDKGLAQLARLSELESLKINGAGITDSGIRYLSRLRRLHQLELVATSVSDGGLEPLKGMKQLRYLDLTGSTVSTAALKSLKGSLPDCEVGECSSIPEF